MSATAEKDGPKQKGDKPKELFPLNIKIKQEKTTSYEDSSKSETVDKLSIDVNLTNIFSTTITSTSSGGGGGGGGGSGGAASEKGSDTTGVDVKPSLEPLKSSNEILTELFRVFNAAPPEIAMIEDDSNEATELEKKKKKHKHKKKSKKRKENLSDEDEQPEDDEGRAETVHTVVDPTSDEGEPTRVKKKKIKKEKDRERKHKRKRHREETLLVTIKQEPVDDYEKPAKDHHHHHHGKHGKDKREEKAEESTGGKVEKVEEPRPLMKGKIQIKSLKNSSIFKELAKGSSSDAKPEHPGRNRHEDDRDRSSSSYRGERSEMRKRHRSDSDFSLSDDERNRNGQKRYYDFYQKKYNSFYASYEEEKHERKRQKRSEDRDHRDHRDHRRHRSSGSHSSRSRSRSPEQFDKQKLLEIAQKNAISMIKKGTLPGVQHLDGDSKTKLISMVRTKSGKSVEELTEYCKKLSHKDNSNDLSSVSSDESDHDADGGSKAFHHPFQLKEQAPIVMNIRNATPLQPKSAEEKKALLMQFPVSSGIPHRATENEWIPVEPKKPQPAPAPAGGKATVVGPVNKLPKLPKNILPPSANFVPQQSQPTVTMEYGILAPGQLPIVATGSATVTQQNPAPLAGRVPVAMNAAVGTQSAVPSAVLGPMFENAQVYPAPPQAAQVAGPVNHQQLNPGPFGNRAQPDPSLVLPVDTSIPPPIIPTPLVLPRPGDNAHMGSRPDHSLMGPRPDHPHMGPRANNSHMGPRPDHAGHMGPGRLDHPHHAGPRIQNHSEPYPPVRHTGGGPSGSSVANGPTNGGNNVFKPPSSEGQQLDVAQIVSQRLNAMRKLQENPTDPDARQLLYNTQKDMSVWASSKVMPGQFLGSTGVNCLSQRELAEGYQPWARRDMMKQSAPVTGGMGMHLLQKMGWQPGEGLGKEKNGSLHPLLLDVKLDKRGLGEGEDKHRNMTPFPPGSGPGPGPGLFSRRGGDGNRSRFPPNQVKVCTEGKHPVSILGEYASKRKWNAPMYELVHESGPGHAKNFIFKVLVNGLEYQPAIANNTKKEAKATAAKFCLQQLGVAIT